MIPAAPPPDEAQRLAELKRLQVLDSFEEQAFDDITRMAADICGTPIALISLIDADRQWFKSRLGLQVSETPREVAFCAHAILKPEETMVVNDAAQDARFVDNPLVTGNPNIRFYASAPLLSSKGFALGSVCVIDSQPREVSAAQLEQLQFLAAQVMAMLEARAQAGLDVTT